MRHAAVLMLGLGLTIVGTAAPALAMGGLPAASAAATPAVPITRVEYYCSPGFVPSYGRCIATASSDEVDLYLNDSGYDEAPVVVRHRRRHHGLHERY